LVRVVIGAMYVCLQELANSAGLLLTEQSKLALSSIMPTVADS